MSRLLLVGVLVVLFIGVSWGGPVPVALAQKPTEPPTPTTKPTEAPTPTVKPTEAPTPTPEPPPPTVPATATPEPLPTATMPPPPTATVPPEPSPTAVSVTASPQPLSTAAATPLVTQLPTITATATMSPTHTPTAAPATATPTSQPTDTSTPEATETPSGDATPAYMGKLTKWIRSILFLRPGLFLLLDEIEAPALSKYQWMLHAFEKMDVKDNNIASRRREAALEVYLDCTQGLTLSQTDKFDTPYNYGIPEAYHRQRANHWHVKAETVKKSKVARIAAVMAVS